MPTRSFEWRKSISLIRFASGTNAGSGPEQHAPIGTNNSGDRFRFLVRFQQDWSGVEVLTKATLKLKGTGGTNHIPKSSGTIRVARLTKSFSDNGGSEGYWVTNAGTVFGGEGGWANAQTFSISPANNKDHELDITPIVQDWLNGSSNYGLMVDDNGGGLQAEFGSGRSGNTPTLVIEYIDATKPTVEFTFPTDENFVPVYGAESPEGPVQVGLHYKVTRGVTDNDLFRNEWEVIRVSDSVVVDSGWFGDWTLPVIPSILSTLDPGETYDLKVTAEGDSGAGVTVKTKRFTVPYGEAMYVCNLGVEPESVGVSVEMAESSDDDAYVHYAKSITSDESGIEGDWAATPPNQFTDATNYYLLIRCRLVRRTPGYIPVLPDGIDRIKVSWRSKT